MRRFLPQSLPLWVLHSLLLVWPHRLSITQAHSILKLPCSSPRAPLPSRFSRTRRAAAAPAEARIKTPGAEIYRSAGAVVVHESSSEGFAHHLFDGMHRTAATCGKDRFHDLTDDLLHHVLSFLPPDEALQTCVLDTRWRDLWRCATSLVLIFDDDRSRLPFSKNIERLAKLIIHLRGNLPLVKCEIHTCPDDAPQSAEHTYTNVKLLVQYAITCQVNELIVRAGNDSDDWPGALIFDSHLISQHLRIMHLRMVDLEHSALDFSGCPVLEDLEMAGCSIDARRISSYSLKRLCMISSCSLPNSFHIRISTPGLISLQLDDFFGSAPLLEYMPFLVTADVALGLFCCEFCPRHENGCDTPDSSCHDDLVKGGVLLNGLSNAADLELIAEPEMIIYRWDLKWCPVFNKLKTLLLNEWFTAIDLVCILKHTPILEMLTLQLRDTKKLLRATGAQETVEQSILCKHLKVVDIECRKVDEGIFKILKILSICGVLHEQISIYDL